MSDQYETSPGGLINPLSMIEALREEITWLRDELNEANAINRQLQAEKAQNAVQEVFVHPDDPTPGLEGDKPLCRFAWYSDGGDPSVGIPGQSYWVLLPDQAGTELESLLTPQS